ncbi:MAG: polysaccharide deacetylase family protein [Lachnospiraceae bacterium]|nr:polysaccharide deacetylase family protein [Lachnospiraceae bacterium]
MENKKLVALTFDDGPSNITEQVLDILEAEGIVGSFFLIGQQITPETKPILERELALGCEICNHSFTHSVMSEMTAEVIRDEIAKTSDIIRDMVGIETKFFRPPYIAVNDTMYSNINMPFICGEDSRDWDNSTSAQDRIDRVLANVTDGTLVLMHDMKDNQKTLDALPAIIKGLREKGYDFVTASQIFEKKGVDPNVPHKLWSHTTD